MREILFRAKRIDNGEWVEGFYQNRFDVNEDIEHLIFWRKSYTVWEYAKIDPDTLCQYTGLKDKNGNRIWENDIVDTPYRRFVVTYSDGVWGDRDGVAMRESIFGEGGTVVGNIFDNPELLKGE